MPTIASVHAAVDAYTQSEMTGIPVIFGNVEDPTVSEGTAAFLKQRVIFTSDSQFILGAPQSSRKRGSVIFIINVRKNKGDKDRNILLDKVLKSFRSKVIGGATFLNGRVVSSGQSENWLLTGVEIPFYFDEL